PAVLGELERELRQRGNFGPGANAQHARNLFQNLMAGDRRAEQLLLGLLPAGEVGEVLRGGKTPKEQQAINARQQEREAKERDRDFEEKKQDAERQAQARQRADRDAQQRVDRAVERKIQDDVELSRRVGQAAGRAGPDRIQHQPLLAPDAT